MALISVFSYCVWLGFELAFIWFLFPETSNRTLEELAFCEISSLHIRINFSHTVTVYEGDVRQEQEKRVENEIQMDEGSSEPDKAEPNHVETVAR